MERVDLPDEGPGRVIATKYELVRLLGEGGMGRVWLAHNLALDTEVAIKLIQPDILAKETTDRLLKEARATARLAHRSVVRVYDFGTDGGQPFIVMEVLVGEPLSVVLDTKGRLPATNAVSLLLPVASALSVAHERGVVHRDLKPENIVLTKDERGRTIPKVVDFGVARLEPSFRTANLHETVGGVVGTPDYMSPEQAKGKSDVDARSDVWAFSVLLYECVTGKRPFEADNYNALLSAICEDEPIPTTLHLAGDPELWDILRKGLAKDRGERWQKMKDLGAALARWAIERGLTADATGASLEEEWLTGPGSSPLSERPPFDSGRRSRVDMETMSGPITPIPPSATTPQGVTISTPVPATPSRRRLWIGLALGATALVGVGMGLALRGSPAPAAASTQPATSAPREEPKVVVSVIVSSVPPAVIPPPVETSLAADSVKSATRGKKPTNDPKPKSAGVPSAKASAKPVAPPPAIPDRPDF